MKQEYTKMQIVLEAFTLVILLSLFAYLITNWDRMPEQMPSHYNFQGRIDSWSNDKSFIFIPIFFCVLLYTVLTFAFFTTKMLNPPEKRTNEKNRQEFQSIKNMLILLKTEFVISFTYITVQTSKTQMLSKYFLPVFLAIIFGTIIYHVARAVKLEPAYF